MAENMAVEPEEELEEDVFEIPEVLEDVMLFALERAKEAILDEDPEEEEDDEHPVLDGSVPFSVVNVRGNYFVQLHGADSEEAIISSAAAAMAAAKGASAYALCFDGFVDDEETGHRDAVIVEGGMPGLETGVVAYAAYRTLGEVKMFDGEFVLLGGCNNYMAELGAPESYADADIDPRYIVPAEADAE